MTDAERELATLRRRAYGPDADLDAAGEERLRELEHRAAPDGSAPESSAEPAHEPAPAAEHAEPTADPADAPDSAPADGPRRSRRLLLAVGVAAAAAVLVALGFVLARPPAVLDAGALAPVPTDADGAGRVVGTASFSIRELDPDSLVQYASLGQGTPWSASGPGGRRCLILTVTDDSPEIIAAAGVWDVACAPAGLDPIIDWSIDPSYPSPPEELPDGSVVRLTLDDDRVRLSIGRAG